MKKIGANNALSLLSKRRLVYSAVIAVALISAVFLVTLRAQALTRANDAATQATWRSANGVSTPSSAPSAEAVFARFNIRRNAATASNGSADELVWQAASSAELSASLVALDAAKVNVRQVKITRSGTAFSVNAERAP
ncbi:MAG: hypothetical protein KA260_11455 [Burkholderiales bacterium]|nr:hypothetical protein [Burkholderiales bacterium]